MKQFGQEKDEAFPGKGRQTSQAALPNMPAGLSSAGPQGKIEFDQAAGQPEWPEMDQTAGSNGPPWD